MGYVGEDPPAVSLSAFGSNDSHGFVLCKEREQFLRFAPTSKKDAPHSYFISLGWRQECTTTTHGVPFGATKSYDRSKSQKLPTKANNTFDGHCPQKRLFVGEDPPAVSLFALGFKDLHDFVLCKWCEQFLKLVPHIKERCTLLMPYKPWLKAWVYHYPKTTHVACKE